MANNITARKNGSWKVVGMVPDVCKTPMGNSTPPIPYPVIANLGDAAQVIPSVKANSDPVVVYDKSKVPKTIGDAAGSAKGIKSGTVGANCYPKDHSSTVRAKGRFIIRHDDEWEMNAP
ncbi:DUF4150 domain-containing protein [Chitinolyticbacter albus]|uniref:DUF4150 domain-containing protein n=1 Tax=Chitinolyticbacter albus TaxID=2961951 RepID=UPI00210A67FF|nr:DUF4150 domain-containing protein [Chitinolyticbacter albus]